jgi:hypothetical protein
MRTFLRQILLAGLLAVPVHAQTPGMPSSQLPQAAVKTSPAPVAPAAAASAPIVVHLVNPPAAQAAVVAAPVQQAAYVVAAPAVQQAVAVAVSQPAAVTPVVHHPGPIRRGLGNLGAKLETLRHDRITIPPAAPAAVTPVQLVTTTAAAPASSSAAVYAAPPAPAVPSAQH